MSKDKKPLASLSLDLDNQWSYLKTHGDPNWKDMPSYFDIFIPFLLEVLDRFDLNITVFVVGQDAALEKNQVLLKQLTEKGHELGNHSFHHEPWFNTYSSEQIACEILDTQNAILETTGEKPIGYRGPGFSWNKKVLQLLSEHDYLYDASTLPTYLGPLARLFYFKHSGLDDSERKARANLFGTFKDGRRPVRPYLWQSSNHSDLLEIPVSTMPILKIPFHLSYLLYLSRFSKRIMLFYLDTALMLLRLAGISPSFLLHPLDLLGGDQVPELAFFPGMDLNRSSKLEIFEIVIRRLLRHYKLVNMSRYAKALLENGGLKKVKVM